MTPPCIHIRLATDNAFGAGRHAGSGKLVPTEILQRPVLVIEDEMMIAWTLEAMLSDMGFDDVVIAAKGDDALEIAMSTKPGLVVSDINLGPNGLDGVDAASFIAMANDAPVVFVSGYAGAESLSRIKAEVRRACVLRKPIGADELRSAIIDICGAFPPS